MMMAFRPTRSTDTLNDMTPVSTLIVDGRPCEPAGEDWS